MRADPKDGCCILKRDVLLAEGAARSVGLLVDTVVEGGGGVPMHFFVRLEPVAGKGEEFREEVLRVVAAARGETGCIDIRVFESLREPTVFTIHSEWVDEAAFETHARLPHTVRFVEAAKKLLTEPVHGMRTREIGGGAGAGAR